MTMRQTAIAAAAPLLLIAVPAWAQAAPTFYGQEFPREPLVIENVPIQLPPPVLILVLPPASPFVPHIAVPPPSLPAPLKALLAEAMKGDDQSMVDNVVKFAVKTDPYDETEIKAMQKAYKDRQTKLAADKKAANEKRIRESRLTQLWAGSFEAGGFRNTGNTRNIGYTVALKLDRKGINWEHIIQATANYQKDADTVSTSQYGANYQARYTLNDALFTYGKGMYERDKIQGFANRYTISSGLGYRFIKTKAVTLSAEMGPALRRTDYVTQPDPGIGRTTWSLATSMDLSWQINKNVKLTEDASSYVGTDNNTFTSATGIEAGMTRRLSVKLSYSWQHETRPPEDTLKTDTISRFSLVYKIGAATSTATP